MRSQPAARHPQPTLITLSTRQFGGRLPPRAPIFHLPLEGVAVDGCRPVMEMGRTGGNLLGNAVAAAVIASPEPEKGDLAIAKA